MTNGMKIPTLEFTITEFRLEMLPLDSDVISLDLGSAFTVRPSATLFMLTLL